jgi:hypothetical protein
MAVRNTGNAAATVFFARGGSTTFGVSPTSPGQTVTAGGTLNTNFTFTPTNRGDFSGSATLSVAAGTVLCSAPPAGVTLTGRGLAPVPVLSRTSIDLGTMNCGGISGSTDLSLRNDGDANLVVTELRWANDRFNVSGPVPNPGASPPTTIVLAPGASTGWKVTGQGRPRTVPGQIGDTMTLVTNAPTPNVSASVTELLRGILLAWEPNPATITTAVGGLIPGSVVLTNRGNLATTAIRIARDQSSSIYVQLDEKQVPSGLTAGQRVTIPMEFAARMRGRWTALYPLYEVSGQPNCGPTTPNGPAPVVLEAVGVYQ